MRSLLLPLLLAVVALAKCDEINPCEEILSGILVHPESCYKYIVCYKEEGETMICPENTIFSVELVQCVPGDQETCVESGAPPDPTPEDNPCRGVLLGQIPHAEDCTKFHRCVLGQHFELTCRNGFIFSDQAFICLPGNADTCNVHLIPTTSTPAPESVRPIPPDYCIRNDVSFGRLAHPQFCNRFVTCALWVPQERFCPNWMVFHDKIRLCMLGNPNNCMTIVGPGASTPVPITPHPPITDDICPNRLVSVLAHPYRCDMFVTCIGGRATENDCPPFTVFSERVSVCLPGDQISCTIWGQ